LESYNIIPYAYHLSEEIKLPIVIRTTKQLIEAGASQAIKYSPHKLSENFLKIAERPDMNDQGVQQSERFNPTVILPANVVGNHNRLHDKLASVKTLLEAADFNRVEGAGAQGVLVSGYTYQKLIDLFEKTIPSELCIARLGSIHPVPDQFIITLLKSIESLIVLEESAPLLENAVRVIAQIEGLTLPILGRLTGEIPRVGELDPSHLANAINCFLPGFISTSQSKTDRAMPSKQFYPSNCPYITIFDALFSVLADFESRQDTIIVGDPGCMVRGQSHYDLMDVKTSLGASISIAAGISRTLIHRNVQKRVIALSGDSGFLHSNFQGLIDAVQMDAQMLVLILDNNTTALSGGQPHPGSRGRIKDPSVPTIEIKELAESSGAKLVRIVEVDSGDAIRSAIAHNIENKGVSIIIARGDCPGCP
jgi:indolepyruvate ferredoxin oxidoreductase alpha subunit